MTFHSMQKNQDGSYTVGFYGVQQGPGLGGGGPGGGRFGLWYPLMSFATFEQAAKWVHFLNGGPNQPEF